MAKHAHISRYYADDKDVVDLISQSAIRTPQLASFLRERGVIVPAAINRADLIYYFRFIPLSWPDFDSLITYLDRTDRSEKKTSCKIAAPPGDLTPVIDILTKIKEERGLQYAEVHQHAVKDSAIIELAVQFTETDPSKTRALQRRERNISIRIEKRNDTLTIRYDDSLKARQIVGKLETAIGEITTEPVPRVAINVSGLNSGYRDEFFTKMAQGLSGYNVDDTQDLKVELPQVTGDSSQSEDEVSDSEQEAETTFQGIVRKALLSGNGLLFSEDYQRYHKAGFSIGKMVWTVREIADVGDVVELVAEFHGENGGDFRYDVLGKYERDDNGSLKKTRVPVRGAEKDKFLSLLEESAYSVLASIREKVEAEVNSGDSL